MKPGGTGVKEDITLRIEKHHYMAPLGFRFRGLIGDMAKSSIKINYPDPETGALKSEELKMEKVKMGELGFGFFVSDDVEKPLFPIGLRSISADIWHGSEEEEKVIMFPIQPGMNYMGVIE